LKLDVDIDQRYSTILANVLLEQFNNF